MIQKFRSIIESHSEGCTDRVADGLLIYEASEACSTLADDFAVGFAEWFCKEYGIRSDYSEHSLKDSIQKDLELYKSQNHGK